MPDSMEMPEALRQLARAWWLFLLIGLLCVAAGIIVLAQPHISLATLAVVAGIFLLLDGIFEVIASFGSATEHRGLVALLGIVTIVVGVVLVRHPSTSIVAIALLVGIWLIAYGVIRFIGAFFQPAYRGWAMFTSIVEVIAGIVIVSSPDIGVITLALFIGIAFVLRGIGMCVIAFALRSAKDTLPGPPGAVPA
jgi:uncharacterized membrane protein HdeD (DUF308 family)